MLFSKCCVERTMKVTPSLNQWPTWTTWCSSMWKSSAGSLCCAISLMRQMETASLFILPSVPSRTMPRTLSAIITFLSFRTRRATALLFLLSNGTRFLGWSSPDWREPGYQPTAVRIWPPSWQHSFAWRTKYRCCGNGWRQCVRQPVLLQPCLHTACPKAHNSSFIWTNTDKYTHHAQTGSFLTWIDIAVKCKAHTNTWDKAQCLGGNRLWAGSTFLF